MADEVRLIATKDIPGIGARLSGSGYHTRRLKAGDEFFVPENMANLLITIKKAEMPRKPGKVAPPPSDVIERAAQATAPTETTVTAPESSAPRPVAAVSTQTSRGTTRKRRATARKPAAKKG